MHILILAGALLASAAQAPNPELAAAELAWSTCLQGQIPRVTAGQTPEAAARQMMSGCRREQHRMIKVREEIVMRSDLPASEKAKMLDPVQTEDGLVTMVASKLRELFQPPR